MSENLIPGAPSRENGSDARSSSVEDERRTGPAVWLTSIEFSDGTVLPTGRHDVIVIVGPNNAGKSAALRAIMEKVQNHGRVSPVISDIGLEMEGSVNDLLDWLDEWTMKRVQDQPQDPSFHALGTGLRRSQIKQTWSAGRRSLGGLARWFCLHLGAEERLKLANPANNVSLVRDPANHPIHYLQRDDTLEVSLSNEFRKAFGEDLVVHRNAGSQVPLHVGDRPVPRDGEDRVSLRYVSRLEELPPLQEQGDGMRSFAGVLLATSVGRETVILIDEPEAFLHPPQARLLGKRLATPRGGQRSRQLFIATHSTDVLRGALDGDTGNVSVLRIRRSGDVNVVRRLDNEEVRRIWGDPLLRYSNILDGIFHEGVIVCEADADCRFYSAVAEAVWEKNNPDAAAPDIMFTHCGGKARLPVAVKALRALEVPVVAVADFDVLRSERPLRDIVEALGGSWSSVGDDWKAVKTAIDAKKPTLKTADVVQEIAALLGSVGEEYLPIEAAKKVRSILGQASTWTAAKASGVAAVPSGEPARKCRALLDKLSEIGLQVVKVGEMESFVKTIGGHGPKWVAEVIRRDLASDAELESARKFVQSSLSKLVA